MCFVTVIVVAFVGFVNIVPAVEHNREAKNFLTMLAQNDGKRPLPKDDFAEMKPDLHNSATGKPPFEENSTFFMSNIATARFNRYGVFMQWSSDREDIYSRSYVLTAAEEILAKDRSFGIMDNQYYMVSSTADGCVVILMDNSVQFAGRRKTLLISCLGGIAVWIAMLLLSIWLVDRMTRPVAVSFARQRQFISDAGHELKTPISVIGANASVLESEVGHNRWLGYINDETRRMEQLVKGLMTLAAVDDVSDKTSHSLFDLSKAAMSICLPFESLAFEKGIIIDTDIPQNIQFVGNEEQLKQLVSILLNNAVKYGSENGIIKITLAKERKRVVLTVYNTGKGVPQQELANIFERFYRVDKARSRDGQSYGLGLAIAKAVCEEHGGRIFAESEYGSWIKFTAELPAK